jgi:hypothetical protein
MPRMARGIDHHRPDAADLGALIEEVEPRRLVIHVRGHAENLRVADESLRQSRGRFFGGKVQREIVLARDAGEGVEDDFSARRRVGGGDISQLDVHIDFSFRTDCSPVSISSYESLVTSGISTAFGDRRASATVLRRGEDERVVHCCRRPSAGVGVLRIAGQIAQS